MEQNSRFFGIKPALLKLWDGSAVCPSEGKEESSVSGRAPSPAGAGTASAQVCQSPGSSWEQFQAPVPFFPCARTCQAGMGSPRQSSEGIPAWHHWGSFAAAFSSISLLRDQSPPGVKPILVNPRAPVWPERVSSRYQIIPEGSIPSFIGILELTSCQRSLSAEFWLFPSSYRMNFTSGIAGSDETKADFGANSTQFFLNRCRFRNYKFCYPQSSSLLLRSRGSYVGSVLSYSLLQSTTPLPLNQNSKPGFN